MLYGNFGFFRVNRDALRKSVELIVMLYGSNRDALRKF